MTQLSRPKTLYITRNGMCEPLGQSQVLAYLRGLSQAYAFTLISFEKPEDLADTEAMARVRATCAEYGIRWLPQRFRYTPALIAPAFSMLQFLWLCLREVRQGNAALIHARSYLPAAVALVVNYLTKTPFIFDMRALWPEELITAGRIRRGSLLHRAMVWAERTCLRRAAGVVSLTHAAVDHLQVLYPSALAAQRIRVIPTCADLDRFVPAVPPVSAPVVYACIGTVLSGWFRIDWLAAFFKVAARNPQAQFQIVTRDNPEQVRAALRLDADLLARIAIFPKPPHLVHEAVQLQSASVMFFTEGLSKLGSSPTRMGEVLGCGLPVVANAGVGDVARIITDYRVGVLVADAGEVAMQAALLELELLMQDPDLARRCRQAAEEVFSLSAGTASYRQLYGEILGPVTDLKVTN
jgi:glycosyltransferase involved in cell wall biosynthesis